MAIDFTSYQPPGVFVEEGSTAVVPTLGTNTVGVAIVGPSRGYQTFSEVIVADETSPVALTKLGIDTTSVVVSSLNGGVVYEGGGVDYTIAAGAGVDGNILDLMDNTATLALAVASQITDGQSLRVTYQFADAAFYEAIQVNDFESVKDYYGDPINPTTGAILSPLSLAAKICFENGAQTIFLVSTAGNPSSVTREQLSAGYAKIAAFYGVSLVVPLPVGLSGSDGSPGDTVNVAGDLQAHVESASLGGFYRVGIVGLAKASTINPVTVAGGSASERVIHAYPHRLSYYNSFANQVIEIDGYYLAAAYAGRIASQAVEMPLTKKVIRGFVGLPSDVASTMTATNKNLWSDGGVSVTELTRQQNLVVRHGTTTDPSDLTTREISVVRAKDSLIRLIEDSVTSAALIGTPIRTNTVIQVKGIVQGALENAVDQGTIVAYTNLGARLRPSDPQVIEVKFEYLPSYPLNYILITFAINTSTGETDLSAGLNLP